MFGANQQIQNDYANPENAGANIRAAAGRLAQQSWGGVDPRAAGQQIMTDYAGAGNSPDGLRAAAGRLAQPMVNAFHTPAGRLSPAQGVVNAAQGFGAMLKSHPLPGPLKPGMRDSTLTPQPAPTPKTQAAVDTANAGGAAPAPTQSTPDPVKTEPQKTSAAQVADPNKNTQTQVAQQGESGSPRGSISYSSLPEHVYGIGPTGAFQGHGTGFEIDPANGNVTKFEGGKQVQMRGGFSVMPHYETPQWLQERRAAQAQAQSQGYGAGNLYNVALQNLIDEANLPSGALPGVSLRKQPAAAERVARAQRAQELLANMAPQMHAADQGLAGHALMAGAQHATAAAQQSHGVGDLWLKMVGQMQQGQRDQWEHEDRQANANRAQFHTLQTPIADESGAARTKKNRDVVTTPTPVAMNPDGTPTEASQKQLTDTMLNRIKQAKIGAYKNAWHMPWSSEEEPTMQTPLTADDVAPYMQLRANEYGGFGLPISLDQNGQVVIGAK